MTTRIAAPPHKDTRALVDVKAAESVLVTRATDTKPLSVDQVTAELRELQAVVAKMATLAGAKVVVVEQHADAATVAVSRGFAPPAPKRFARTRAFVAKLTKPFTSSAD